MPSRRYYVLLNVNSGAVRARGLTPEALERRFLAEGYAVTIDKDSAAPLADRIARAVESGADIVVAAGGDGTVTAVASAVLGSGQAVAILPLGTANLLARDLHVPLDLDAAVAALDDMRPRKIDVGEVNGRIFLHGVSIGSIVIGPALERERIRGRPGPGTVLGFLRHFFRHLRRARRITVEIAPSDGVARVERVHAIAVGNNDYVAGPGRIFSRDRLDGGRLTVFVLRRLSITDFFRLAAGMLLGTWRENPVIEIENVTSVTIRTSRRQVKAMIDGEVETLSVPLQFRIRPAALTILAPAAEPVRQPELPLVATES